MKQAGIVLLILSGAALSLGIGWIATYYLSAATLPIAALGNWNILVGAVPVFSGMALGITGLVLTLVSRKR